MSWERMERLKGEGGRRWICFERRKKQNWMFTIVPTLALAVSGHCVCVASNVIVDDEMTLFAALLDVQHVCLNYCPLSSDWSLPALCIFLQATSEETRQRKQNRRMNGKEDIGRRNWATEGKVRGGKQLWKHLLNRRQTRLQFQQVKQSGSHKVCIPCQTKEPSISLPKTLLFQCFWSLCSALPICSMFLSSQTTTQLLLCKHENSIVFSGITIWRQVGRRKKKKENWLGHLLEHMFARSNRSESFDCDIDEGEGKTKIKHLSSGANSKHSKVKPQVFN